MKKIVAIVVLIISINNVYAQKEAYQIYTKDGKLSSYDKMLKELEQADIVLFGELHNNAISHWLELEVAKDLYKKNEHLKLGAEMFEADNQIVLDEFLSGQILHKHFTEEAKMWNNYSTDYKPLVEFAKEKNLRFIATNVPRRYANFVARNGINELDKLSKEALQFVAPIPIEVDFKLECYKMFLDMQMGHGSEMTPQKMAEAQAVKDATMAYFIMQNFKQGDLFIHYNGAYHSDNFQSIHWFLKRANKDLKIVTISTTEQENINQFDAELKDVADFILVIPESMTKTY